MKNTLVALILLSACSTTRAQLIDYVQKPDPTFKWSLVEKKVADSGTTYILSLTSQTWHGIEWTHDVLVYMPSSVKPGETIVLFNDGGKIDPIKSLLAFELSKRGKIPVAFLLGIPKQPLYDGKREDALIAETFVRYLDSGDGSWPLLFPMVKSVVKCMDALQAFSKQEWKTELKSFVVSGASKRGWTSWLTGAADSRVKAIAPMVIDTLNMKEQLALQITSFGKPSDMIRDYTQRGLIPIPKGERAELLWKMVDPYMYREKVVMPKLLINGTNDPYWPQDAMNLYWDQLQGEKWALYVPNAGHGLDQKFKDKPSSRDRAINTLAVFGRKQLKGESLPKLTWKHDDVDGKLQLKVTSNATPKAVRTWSADSTTRDFRKSIWSDAPAKFESGSATILVDRPTAGWRTFFAELEFEEDGVPYYLSTQLRMTEAAKK